jgi:1-acyl-sn-glycerol-3-phosphate acyltransferase
VNRPAPADGRPVQPARTHGLDPDRTSDPESLLDALRRRLSGRYPIDPFGLDPQLCDAGAPIVEALVRVRVEGAPRIPADGPAVFVMNRGLGILEPTALAIAVRRQVGRRLRVVGTPGAPFIGGLLRRLGSVNGSPDDLAACLRAGHLVAVPLAPTWLRTGAGTPPLRLVQAMMGWKVLPVAVTAGGPLGTAFAPWHIRIGEHIALDASYASGDPLGAAELAEEARAAVDALLGGEEPAHESRPTLGLAAG